MQDIIFRTGGGFPEMISVRLPRDLREEVAQAAEKAGLTIAEFCRRTLARGVAEAGS